MDDPGEIELARAVKRSMAALFLQASISFLAFNLDGSVNTRTMGWIVVLLMVMSTLSFVLAIEAAARHWACWIFPTLSICIVLILFVMAFRASFASGGPWC